MACIFCARGLRVRRTETGAVHDVPVGDRWTIVSCVAKEETVRILQLTKQGRGAEPVLVNPAAIAFVEPANHTGSMVVFIAGTAQHGSVFVLVTESPADILRMLETEF